MTVRSEHHYDEDVETIFRAFSDADYVREKYEACGSRNVEVVECERVDGGANIRVRREVPADVPGFAAKFLGEWNSIEETLEWRAEGDAKRCHFEASVASTPVSLRGNFLLRPEGTGSVQELELEATVSVPFIGGKIAEVIDGTSEKNLRADHEFTREYLKRG